MIAHVINCAGAKHRTLRGLRSSLKGLGAIEESVDPQGFSAFPGTLGRLWRTACPAIGSRRDRGFSVMRSPDRGLSKVGRRIASQPPLDRAGRCSDAMAPVSREAESTRTGLALLCPSTIHQ
jgi:hypothetical protein